MQWLEKMIRISMLSIKKRYPSAVFTRHFELNKSGEVHAHGILHLAVDYTGYDLHLKTIEKLFNKMIGRPKVNSSFSSRCLWVSDIEHVARYINKENVFVSNHQDLQLYLTEWLLPTKPSNIDEVTAKQAVKF